MAIQEDELVGRAEKIVLEARNKLSRGDAETGKTQASKAIEVAQEAKSLRVFYNWLRYQMAREDFWRIPLSEDKPLAQRIAEEAQWIQQKAGSLEEALKAVLRFLGYFRRALVAVEHLDRIPGATGGGEC